MILEQLGLPRATFYRWQVRELEGRMTDEVVVPERQVLLATPAEVRSVCDFALDHPKTGYKRLTWQMVDEDTAYLRPHQVYAILSEHDLLCRQNLPQPEPLKRPPEPDYPDHTWHIDLMYLYIAPCWYYLVDILDSYSRYLVHWTLNLTMTADTVTLTVQQALDQLTDRQPGEPKIVHDNGGQFLSAEWQAFVKGAEVTPIKTRVAHPQSNGRLERLHRTHREEGLSEEILSDYYQALDVMTEWSHFYNTKRPHSALKYLRPMDYYRGNPDVRLAERERKLMQAAKARQAHWGKGACDV